MAENKVDGPAGGTGDKPYGRKPKKSPGKSRQTHFICLPLVTSTSIPQLKDSLQRFRAISTASSKEDRDAKSSRKHSRIEDQLKVIPKSAHQALGKYHLTLGTMDLSEEVEMQRAKDLLTSLDLGGMLKSAERPDAVLEAKRQRRGPRQPLANVEVDNPAKDSDGQHGVLESLDRPISPPTTHEVKSEPEQLVHSEHNSNSRSDPLVLTLSGLGAFPSSKSARVFWAKPHEQSHNPIQPTSSDSQDSRSKSSSRLYTFALLVRQRFREAGFITETRPLVLHATVANIRQAVQPNGGRTSKGTAWSRGGQRWKDGCVDARGLIEVFDRWDGDVESAMDVLEAEKEDGVVDVAAQKRDGVQDEEHDGDGAEQSEDAEHAADGSTSGRGPFVWARDIVVDRVALCKMGAERCENDILEGEWYPHLAEKIINEE